MQTKIKYTGKGVEVNGALAPLWEGATESGQKFLFVVTGWYDGQSRDFGNIVQLHKQVPMHGLSSYLKPLMVPEQAAPAAPAPAAPAPATAKAEVAAPPMKRPARRIDQVVPKPKPVPVPAPVVVEAPAPVRAKAKPLKPVAPVSPPPTPVEPWVAPVPRMSPAAAQPAAPVVAPFAGELNPALKRRLEQAAALLAGRGRGDGHDRNQARKLLDSHRDKLHLVTGAARVLELPELEESTQTLD